MTDSNIVSQSEPSALAWLHDTAAFNHLWRVATAFSQSCMVPDCYAGKPAACMVALMYAARMGENPMLIFAEMAPYKGKPITSAKFAIGRANKSGLLHGPITWKSRGQGTDLEVTASAKLRETGETVTATVTMREAAADGWTRNAKYQSIPEQMLRWRSATRLINLYIPEVLAGAGVREEVEVRTATVSDVTPATGGAGLVQELNQQIAGQISEAPVDVVAAATPASLHVVEPPQQQEVVMVDLNDPRREF